MPGSGLVKLNNYIITQKKQSTMIHVRRGGSNGTTKDKDDCFVPIHPQIAELLRPKKVVMGFCCLQSMHEGFSNGLKYYVSDVNLKIPPSTNSILSGIILPAYVPITESLIEKLWRGWDTVPQKCWTCITFCMTMTASKRWLNLPNHMTLETKALLRTV